MMELVKVWPEEDKNRLLEELFREYARREKEFIARAMQGEPAVVFEDD